MYPYIRMTAQMLRNRNAPPLPLDGTHISYHRCLPWDIDPFMELNNGRTLTLYDLGRLPLALRTGLVAHLKRQRWSLTMAGVSVRYRRRIRTFEQFEMRSRCVGWDDKFFYLDQSMWVRDVCAGQALYRAAIVSRDGIVPPAKVIDGMTDTPPDLTLPSWVQAWIDADAERPWPPTA
ncbi:acyl-CoA thioesterase [Actibacterium sp. 188UL27-1]|uniref:acyl-CoA thioesterase n=1 Tax=Actibacterium sp. 188UL27-1 TaxID=2786961 RepID=UPI00195B95B3|nr:acyl-CoA thioesterase [Actibacterium sp. 188UL27-1]MBM7067112.1 acyl-CoA thioesterase [Actibacterium sp. 188UL27-1]